MTILSMPTSRHRGISLQMWGKFRACSLCWSVTGEPVIEGDALALQSCGQGIEERCDRRAVDGDTAP
jgi:hypothetical protein